MKDNKKVSVFTMIGAFVGAAVAVVAARVAADPQKRKKLQAKLEDFKKQMAPKAEVAMHDAAALESKLENKADKAVAAAKKKVSYIQKTAVKPARKIAKKA